MAKMDAKGCEPNDIIYVENYLTKLDQQLDDQELKKRWDDTQKDYDMHSQMILQVSNIVKSLWFYKSGLVVSYFEEIIEEWAAK